MPSSTSSSKTFVRWFLAVLAVLVVGFGVGSEVLIRTRVEPNHNFYEYLRLFRDSKSVNAIFGDSHAAYGLTGNDGFVNLANAGDSMYGIYEKLRTYFAGRRPGKVILQAGLHHFSRGYHLWRPADAEFTHLLDTFDPLTPRILTGPSAQELFGYWRVFLSGHEFVPRHPILSDGSRPVARDGRYLAYTPQHRRVGALRYARQVEPVVGVETSPVAGLYVRAVDYLLERGARVCLVTFPVTTDFKGAVRKLPRFARAREFFANLAKRKGIGYVDGWEVPLPDEMFDDYDHLSADGARRLTSIVVTRCFSNGNPERKPKALSPTDPAAAWTTRDFGHPGSAPHDFRER